jgi:Calcineurin-like phosphoesterase
LLEYRSITMRQIKFIHCADMHLGTPFGTAAEMPLPIAELLRSAPRLALTKIVDTAIEHSVDFVLIAGDIFDGPVINLRDLRFLTSELARLDQADIPCCAICGNHDPLAIWPRDWPFPEKFHLFGSETDCFAIMQDREHIADIIGFSYPEKELKKRSLRGFKQQSTAVPTIGMLHTAMAPTPDRYMPCSTEDLLGCDLAYWALGHVHQRRDERTGEPFIGWSGAPQKLNPNETGSGGFYLVKMDANGRFERDFIIADSVRFAEIKLDASSCPELELLPQYIADEIRNAVINEGVPMIVRAVVTGRCNYSSELRCGGRFEEIVEVAREELAMAEPCIHLDVLELKIHGTYDLDKLINESSLSGDIAAAVRSAENNPATFAEDVKSGIEPLFYRWKNKRLLEPPTDAELTSLASDAAEMLLDRLLEESD